jgi:hypothetical protein
MRTKDARLDDVDKNENDFATKKASYSQKDVSRQDWYKRKETNETVDKKWKQQ